MEAVIIVLLVALLAIGGAAVWLLVQRGPAQASESQRLEQQMGQRLDQQMGTLKSELGQAITASQQTLFSQVSAVDTKLNQRLSAVQTDVSQSLTKTTETIGKIGEQLGGLSKAAERILEVGQDVSSLRDVLQPPKLRGNFGELMLEQLLAQILPAEYFSTQYRFKSGDVVDAVIHIPEGLVPVDSKFPIDSFRRVLEAPTDEERARQRRVFVRDVRDRIEEVAKYIRPEENTLDFALMYVPAENIYYETILGTGDESPMTFALDRRVHLVSPNTFHAFLQALARGFNGLRVERNAKQILARLAELQSDFDRFREEFGVLGTHVTRAKNKYEDVDRLAGRLGDRLASPLAEPAQTALEDGTSVNGADEPG